MKNLEIIKKLNEILLDELPNYKGPAKSFSEEYEDQRKLLRALMNIRPAELPLKEEYLSLQDKLLSQERVAKGIVNVKNLKESKRNPKIYLWQGDITLLNADAIVNAANNRLLGCFIPNHKCIDNAIHSAAGSQLREECYKIMKEQAHPEKTGEAKITNAYNLPSKYVIHTVGPIITGNLREKDIKDLANCYLSVLNLANDKELESLAFCCISTGEFHFPKEKAAEIALATTEMFLMTHPDSSIKQVIFNVFTDSDYEIYNKLLN